jgi:hypothetical protein
MGNLTCIKEGNCLFFAENLIHLEKISEYQNCKGVGFKTADFLLEVKGVHYFVEVKRLEVFNKLFCEELKENLKKLRKNLKKEKFSKEVKKQIDDCLSECPKKTLKDLREKLKDSLLFIILNSEKFNIRKLNYVVFLCPSKRKPLSYDITLPLKDNLSRILRDSIKGFESCLKIPFEVKVAFWEEPKPFDKVLIDENSSD